MHTCAISRAGDLLDRHHVVGVVRLGHQRPELAEVDLDAIVVLGAVLGADVDEVVLAVLALRATRLVVSSGGKTAAVAPSSAIMLAIVARSGMLRSAVPGPVNSNTLFLPPLARQPAQQLEDDVLGLDPGPVQLVLQVDLDDLGAGDLVRVPAEHDGHVEPAGADRDHAQAPRLHGVGVGAEHRLPGLAEALHVDVVADPVARAREVQPVLAGQRLEHAVVVGVLEVELDDVVVDVLDRALDLDARLAELLELHQRHRAGGVLEQRLVHADRDRPARLQLPVGEVLLEDLAGQVLGHGGLSSAGGSGVTT